MAKKPTYLELIKKIDQLEKKCAKYASVDEQYRKAESIYHTLFDKPIKILLFKDNPGDARLFTETLKDISSQRYEITHVGSLAEGLSILANKIIDIILLDLGLPDSQRLDTLTKLKSQVLEGDTHRRSYRH
jgi:response regulator RpfG family c-di-GMP phosphodiesterase